MRRRTEAAVAELAIKGVVLLLALALVYWAVTWPWMVGSHRSVAFAWALEIAYLLLVGDIAQFAWRGRRARRAQAVLAQAALDQTHREQAARERAARAQAAQRDQAAREQADRERAAQAAERRRIEHATPRWARLATDTAGLERWWDGTGWTDDTRWEFSAVRPDGRYFTHGTCTVKHRTGATASQCRRG